MYRKTEETNLCWRSYGRNGGPVHREGYGVPQNGTPRDTVHLHHRPPPASTSYSSSTVGLLQPPPATVHPQAPVHPASTARSSTGYCSTNPLHGVLFNHPSMGYCSSSPPHHGVLFIQRQRHRSLFIQPPPSCNAHCSSQRQHRSASVSSSSEGINRSVQLTAIDRSLGFSNA